ncbi:hypothetical protein [Mesorhizobium sp. NPDC059025]|uniref:hypothetical protein n=1 Tax=unclassified Mesorhizobium TaxID=325217 RepID=UPI00366B4AB7
MPQAIIIAILNFLGIGFTRLWIIAGVQFPMQINDLSLIWRNLAQDVFAKADFPESEPLRYVFAKVPRQNLLGSDPRVMIDDGRKLTALQHNNPAVADRDVSFILFPWLGSNNGGPAPHVRLFHASPSSGQTVLHVGAGMGYYPAILLLLVGATGKVIALELDSFLDYSAKICLKPCDNVEVIVADAAACQLPVDHIHGNLAACQPDPNWIDPLALRGRLIFPLGAPDKPQRPIDAQFFEDSSIAQLGLHASHLCDARFIREAGRYR